MQTSKAALLLIALLVCIACKRTPDITPESLPSLPAATPDPAAGHRAQLVTRINALPDSECDTLVLQLQLVPRDEILDPISKPKNELIRYVKRIASAEELDAVERAIKERMEHRNGPIKRRNSGSSARAARE